MCVCDYGTLTIVTCLPLMFVYFWRYGQTNPSYFVSNFFVEISTPRSTCVEEKLQLYRVFCYKFRPKVQQVHGNDYKKINSHPVEFLD